MPDNYSVGIVSFSTSAEPVLPPTTDREAARTALAELRLGSGTAIGDAITRSVDLALDRTRRAGEAAAGERSPAAVLLLSDGAQTAGDIRPGPAAQRARRLGVPVSTVALGTRDAVVEVPRAGGLKERVVVAPDVADAAGASRRPPAARFSEAPSAARLESVYRELGTRLARDRKRVEVTSAFAAGGAVLLLVGSTLSLALVPEGPVRRLVVVAIAARDRLGGGPGRRGRSPRGRTSAAACRPASRSPGPWVAIPAPTGGAASTVVWELRCPLARLHRRRASTRASPTARST